MSIQLNWLINFYQVEGIDEQALSMAHTHTSTIILCQSEHIFIAARCSPLLPTTFSCCEKDEWELIKWSEAKMTRRPSNDNMALWRAARVSCNRMWLLTHNRQIINSLDFILFFCFFFVARHSQCEGGWKGGPPNSKDFSCLFYWQLNSATFLCVAPTGWWRVQFLLLQSTFWTTKWLNGILIV